MKINVSDLKIVVVEKENVDIYCDFLRLIESMEKDETFIEPLANKEIIDILNNEGQIYMFKCRNVYASSCLIKKNSSEEIEYCQISVFQDFRGNKIGEYMIKRVNDLCKKLGYKDAIISIDEKDKRAEKIVQNLKFEFIGKKDYNGTIKNIYRKAL